MAGLYIRVGLTGSAALGTGSNAVPESAAHLLTLCTRLVTHEDAPCRPGSTPPHPSAEMTLVSEGRIHLQCVLYNISLTMQ